MTGELYPYKPDYATPPGWLLEDELECRGISQAEFARQCKRSGKHISDIVAGNAPIDAATAGQFEKALGIDADLWLRMESIYRRRLAHLTDTKHPEEQP